MDPETEAGESPDKYATKLVNAILAGDKDLTPFPYSIVHWLRVTFPTLFYYLMERRADRLAARYRNTQNVWGAEVIETKGWFQALPAHIDTFLLFFYWYLYP